jgi:hypothetical protein
MSGPMKGHMVSNPLSLCVVRVSKSLLEMFKHSILNWKIASCMFLYISDHKDVLNIVTNEVMSLITVHKFAYITGAVVCTIWVLMEELWLNE